MRVPTAGQRGRLAQRRPCQQFVEKSFPRSGVVASLRAFRGGDLLNCTMEGRFFVGVVPSVGAGSRSARSSAEREAAGKGEDAAEPDSNAQERAGADAHESVGAAD